LDGLSWIVSLRLIKKFVFRFFLYPLTIQISQCIQRRWERFQGTLPEKLNQLLITEFHLGLSDACLVVDARQKMAVAFNTYPLCRARRITFLWYDFLSGGGNGLAPSHAFNCS
jgi:hypothetical protein